MLGCRPMQGTDEIRQVRTGRRKIWLITHTNMQELSYSTSLVSRQIHCPPCVLWRCLQTICSPIAPARLIRPICKLATHVHSQTLDLRAPSVLSSSRP